MKGCALVGRSFIRVAWIAPTDGRRNGVAVGLEAASGAAFHAPASPPVVAAAVIADIRLRKSRRSIASRSKFSRAAEAASRQTTHSVASATAEMP